MVHGPGARHTHVLPLLPHSLRFLLSALGVFKDSSFFIDFLFDVVVPFVNREDLLVLLQLILKVLIFQLVNLHFVLVVPSIVDGDSRRGTGRPLDDKGLVRRPFDDMSRRARVLNFNLSYSVGREDLLHRLGQVLLSDVLAGIWRMVRPDIYDFNFLFGLRRRSRSLGRRGWSLRTRLSHHNRSGFYRGKYLWLLNAWRLRRRHGWRCHRSR